MANAWPASAQLAFSDALRKGLSPAQAKDFAAAQYGESGFNPAAVNKSSGAAGLYQLLSPGYVQKANALGGVLNPEANIQAILPDYASYYKSHPQLTPGAAAAAVERSGQGADYYAQGYNQLGGKPSNVGSSLSQPKVTPAGFGSGGPGTNPLLQLAQNLLAQSQGGSPVQLALQRMQAIQAQSSFGQTPSADSRPAPAQPLPQYPKNLFSGASTAGEDPGFLSHVVTAAKAAGATQIRVSSGRRSAGHNAAVGGVQNSNHLTGHALDGEAFVPGKGWVPLGTLLRGVAPKFGLRSGDQPGFFNGGRDPVHVDDGFNQKGSL